MQSITLKCKYCNIDSVTFGECAHKKIVGRFPLQSNAVIGSSTFLQFFYYTFLGNVCLLTIENSRMTDKVLF